MKLGSCLMAAVIVPALLSGCVPFLRGSGNPANPAQPKAQGIADQVDGTKPLNRTGELISGQDQRTSGAEKASAGDPVPDSTAKEEINRAALEFAGKLPNVKHVKTCYSNMYSEWNLYLYAQRGKKLSYQQYLWNKQLQQWEREPLYKKDLQANQLEFHVRGEVGDEKCFVLK